MALRIESWQWDEWNLEELADHGLTRRTVLQVSAEAPRFRGNIKKNRAASHMMIGPDKGGAFWVVCIVELDSEGIWRAITGWSARKHEIEWYRRTK
jgi:hypothetical protein